MYEELKELLHDAEEHYLKTKEIENFRNHISSLQERLAVYKLLRDQEIGIFQAIANQLDTELSPDLAQHLSEAILNWVSILRYVAMGMLLNSSEFIHRRILEWLSPVIQAHERVSLDDRLYQILHSYLKEILDEKQWELLHPFLTEVQSTISPSNVLVS